MIWKLSIWVMWFETYSIKLRWISILLKGLQKWPEEVGKFLNTWEIRGAVLSSLLIQMILIGLGSKRRHMSKPWIRILVWPAYLFADTVATIALGILSRSKENSGDNFAKATYSLHAFWAPFLLLHLGGPDTITAYAIEDNELWLRHLFNLVIQVAVAAYIFFTSWGITSLSFIAVPVYVSGIIKYGERTWVLRCSSSSTIKESLLSTPPRLRLDTREIMVVPRKHYPPMTDYLHQAYYLFKMSVYLFEEFILSFTELKDSHSIISCLSSTDAFKLIDIELGFMFELLYTKAGTIYTRWGIFFRSVSFLSSISAFISFMLYVDKHAYLIGDVAITYSLLVGAISLELYAFFRLIFSDRTMIWLTEFGSPPTNPFSWIVYSLYTHFTKDKRRSGSTAQYNLIRSSLEGKTSMCLKLLGIDNIRKYMLIKWEDEIGGLKDLVFEQLLEKGNEILWHLDDANLRDKLLSQRGNAVLERMKLLEEFRWSTSAVEFHHSLLVWHIATDLFYYHDDKMSDLNCKISKIISDYMYYLLVLRPNMLPKGTGDAGSRHRDASEELKRFFEEKKKQGSNKKTNSEKEASMKLLRTNYATLEDKIATPIDTTPTIPGAYGRSKYISVHGCMLANQFKLLTIEDKWDMISKVWIEMLAYAAVNCDWREHAQQLRRGGELLTHVCLLMAHLGLSKQYQEIHVN